MYICDYMTREPIIISPDTLITKAREILQAHSFRHLPVLDQNGKLVGMVTDRDIRSACPSSLSMEIERKKILKDMASTTVDKIMSKDLTSLYLSSTLDDALLIFQNKKVGAIPVVDEDGKLFGIFSIRDLIKAYGTVFGLGEKGSCLVAIRDEEGAATVKKTINVLIEKDIPFTRFIRSQQEKIIYVRVNTFNLKNLYKTLTSEGLEIVSPPHYHKVVS